MPYTVHTKEFPHGITAKVFYDEDAPNPRAEWDQLFTIATRSNIRYDLGGAPQDHTYSASRDLMLRLLAQLHPPTAEGQAALAAHEAECGFNFDNGLAVAPAHIDPHADEDADAYNDWIDGLRRDPRYECDPLDGDTFYATDGAIMEEVERHYIIQPLYLYDHGGITISTGAFSCQWDYGQVGWMYIKRSDAAKHWPDAESDAVVCKAMDAELAEYDAYLRGECYSYTVTDAEGEYLESVGGYIGDLDYVIAEAEADAQRHADAYEKAQLGGLAELEMSP